MLKRLYRRFLLWALAPVLDPLRIDEKKIVESMRGASIHFEDLILRAQVRQDGQVVQAGVAITESGGFRYVYPDGAVGASMSKV